MEKFVTLVLNSEEQAFKASQEIVGLGKQGEISINELYILTRQENGEVKVLDVKNGKIPYTASGGMIGGLFGILGGPLGVLFGITTGLMAGSIGDLIRISKSKKFIDKASKAIPVGQTAILGNITETWEVPLNTTLKHYGAKIQRVSLNEALAKLAEEEQLRIQHDIQKIEQKINKVDSVEKEKLENELTKLNSNYELLDKDNSKESKFSQWIDKVKSNLDRFKDNLSDYFEDEKEELLDEYHEVREEYRELNYKISSGLKRLKKADEYNFKSTINYLKEEIREFDEEIKKLEIEVAKLQGDDRLRWNDKLQKLHSKRAELINETKNSILTFSKNNELWIKDISQNIN